MTGRRHGPATSWELELDSLADRLAADTSRQADPTWRARVAAPAALLRGDAGRAPGHRRPPGDRAGGGGPRRRRLKIPLPGVDKQTPRVYSGLVSETTTQTPQGGPAMLHTTDTTPEPTETRHYESFQICWEGGSRWTGFETLDLAWAALQGSSREGHIERQTWSVEIPASRLALYRPGIPADDSHLGC